jgi:hypothetical protein
LESCAVAGFFSLDDVANRRGRSRIDARRVEERVHATLAVLWILAHVAASDADAARIGDPPSSRAGEVHGRIENDILTELLELPGRDVVFPHAVDEAAVVVRCLPSFERKRFVVADVVIESARLAPENHGFVAVVDRVRDVVADRDLDFRIGDQELPVLMRPVEHDPDLRRRERLAAGRCVHAGDGVIHSLAAVDVGRDFRSYDRERHRSSLVVS